MTDKEVFKKLKEYCESELKFYNNFGKSHKANVNQMIDRCYGAMMYSAYLFSPNDGVIGKWWDDEMLPKLKELS